MNIIFEYEGNKLILPVNPEKLRVSIPSQSQKVEVLGTGEVSVPQRAKLATASISSFFWDDLFRQNFISEIPSFIPTSFVSKSGLMKNISNILTDDSTKFKVLNEYVKWFKEWQASEKPARFTVVVPPEEPPQCYDFYVTCEKFDYEIRAGEDTDFYYELELLEWRDYGAKVLTPEKQKNGKTRYTEKTKQRIVTKTTKVREVTCTARDSIWSIAQRHCNGNWKALVNDKINIEKLTNSPDNIKDMIIKIPKEYIR